mgnify:CR=1 FL=1
MGVQVEPPTSQPQRTRPHAGAWAVAGALAALAALALAAPSCDAAGSCLHAVGGGARRTSGALPQHRVRSPRCWPAVVSYFESGAYDRDVAEVGGERGGGVCVCVCVSGRAFRAWRREADARRRGAPHPSPPPQAVFQAGQTLGGRARPTASDVIVLDIDETSVSNRGEWLRAPRGAARAWTRARALLADPEPPSDLEAALAAARLRGDAPALAPTLALYKAARSAGFSVAFITGRRDGEASRAATIANLEAAGYGVACDDGKDNATATAAPAAPSCYHSLTMRPAADQAPVSVYKAGARAALEGKGLTIAASLGDQFSDLAGPAPADASFKLPNPVYYIL